MTTRIADVVVPEVFSPYVQQLTEQKSRLIRSGAVMLDDVLNNNLSGAGLTFNEPSFRDLEDTEENVSNDDPNDNSTPNKIGTGTEIQIRLSRNNSWSSMNLTADLAGVDPMDAIANRVSDYWVRREQQAFIATIKGVFADNAAAPTAQEHVQNDMTFDISGASFSNGVTNFSSAAFIDTTATMGDSMEDLGLVMVHSIVYARMLKNNLIDFIPDAINPNAKATPTFLGRVVIVDDAIPNTAGVFESWLFGAGAVRMGRGLPKNATEVESKPSAGNGAGQEILYNRKELIIHPVGNAFVATPVAGGPSNLATTGNLANAASWQRVFSERKQIKMARLITREYAGV